MVFLSGGLFKDILSIFIAAILIVYVLFKKRFKYWENKGVPYPQPEIPFGNAKNHLLRRTAFAEIFSDAYKQFKSQGLKYYGFYISTNPVFIIIDPEFIKTIITKDFQHFADHGTFVDEEREPLTGHLFSLTGLKWKNLRAKLTPTFTSGKMKMMFHTVADCTKGMVEVVDDVIAKHEALDIKDVSARYTTDVIGSCAFGLECNTLRNPDSDIRKYSKVIFGGSFKQILARSIALVAPKLLPVFNLTFFDKEASNFFMNVVKETVEYRETNNVSRRDFMHLLIQLKNNFKIKDDEHVETLTHENAEPTFRQNLTMNELSAQAFVIFFAGFETSSTTLTFCLYELVNELEIQEKLQEEVKRVLHKHNGKITYEAIMDMPYMDKCFQETLRKYPPMSLLFRQCTLDYKIPDTDIIIPKGTRTIIPIIDIQHDPEYYPNPEKFDPERFSPENKAGRHPFTWLPFGGGPRACIGLRFGLMQAKVALACLLKNYRFTLNSKTQVPLKIDPKSNIMAVKGGVWLNAEKI